MIFQRKGSGVSWLLVGLGNPGSKYEITRHNMGFLAVDGLARRKGFRFNKLRFRAWTAEWMVNGEKVLVMKPVTYMNLSGNSVVKAASFYKILPDHIVVIHDDMDLPAGRLKAKLGGGAGGHNGLKSIDAAVTSGYNRIRIGVGHPEGRGAEVVNYVLGGFSKADRESVESVIELVLDTLPVLLEKGMAAYSNLIGMKTSR